jgi:hypothetical protein
MKYFLIIAEKKRKVKDEIRLFHKKLYLSHIFSKKHLKFIFDKKTFFLRIKKENLFFYFGL